MTYCRGPTFTPWLLLTADQWMPATTDRHRITVAWNVRFDNTCQPLSAPFTWPAFFWRCSGLILKDFRPSVTHGNTNVLIGVDTHKHVMPHASLKEQYNTNLGKTLFWNLVFCPLDRSQSLFYFVPQEKNITAKLISIGAEVVRLGTPESSLWLSFLTAI